MFSKKKCVNCASTGLRSKKSDKPTLRPVSKAGAIRKAADAKYYRASWDAAADDMGGCRCEECRAHLPVFSPNYVSHILSRGAHPEMAHDPDNHNILCQKCHDQWEFGDRTGMNIGTRNAEKIARLYRKYQ